MSVENVKKFFKKAISNKILGQKLEKIKDELQNPSIDFTNYEHIINTKIIPIAEEVGLNFNTKDFLDYVGEISHELDEKDLLNVSGGFSANKSIAALGILLTFAPFAPNFAAIAEDVNKVQGSNQQPSTSILQTTKNQSVAQYKFKPSKIKSFAPTIFGGKSIEEQEKDYLVNYMKKNNITDRAQVSKKDLSWFDKAVKSTGKHLTENTINGTYYLEGTIPDESQTNELNLIHKMYSAQKSNPQGHKQSNINFSGLNLSSKPAPESSLPNQNADVNKGTRFSVKKSAVKIANKFYTMAGSAWQKVSTFTASKNNFGNDNTDLNLSSLKMPENISIPKDTLIKNAGVNCSETKSDDLEVSIDGNLKEQRGFLDNLMESLNQNPAKLKKVEGKKDESKEGSKSTAEEASKETLSLDNVNLGTENNRNNERTEEITTSSETKSTISGAKNAADIDDVSGTSKEAISDKTITIKAESKPTEIAASANAETSSVAISSESKSAETTAPVSTEVNAKITPAEDNAESKVVKIISPALAASTTDQTSKNSNDKIKYFSATNEFKEWRDNGDSTVTATDLHEPGTTYTFVRYNSSSTLQEMIPNLISVIKRIGNDTNRIWVEDRFNFLRDIRYFIGHTWNGNTGHLEVEGIAENDSNLKIILDFWTNVLGRKPIVILDVQEDLPLSEKMEEIVKTIKRLDYMKNVNDPEKLISLVREIVCSKAYDTEDGTAKEWVNNASPKDKENFEFLKNVYKNYKGLGKSMQYTKPGSLLDRNGLTEDAEKVINNWVKIGNSILSIDELYETDKSEFKRDAENIALNIQILLQDGDVYYGMPGVVPPKTIINFVNIYYNLGLPKNISYTSVNSNDLNLLSNNLGAANKEIGNNIFNLAKDDVVNYVKDWERAQELIKQHKANNEGTANADNDKVNAPIGRAAQRLEVLNQTSEKELLDQARMATDKTEKKNAIVKFLREKKKKNNVSKAQGDQNAALSEAKDAQNSQNEAQNHVDASSAETLQNGQNKVSKK